MATFAFPFPTTGSITFTDFLTDPSNRHTLHLADATAARANVRGVLKTDRRTSDGEGGALAVLNAVEEYLPHLVSIAACLPTDDLLCRTEPVFSWRATLSSSLGPNPSRLDLPSLLAERAFVLLTYLYSLANLSNSVVLSLSTSGGSSRSYELDQTLPTAERKKKDERLSQAADLLCRAAGVAEHLCEKVVGEWETERARSGGAKRGPVEGSRAFLMGLAKMLLADAQLLAIRKLLAPCLASSSHIGPPLVKGHPSPSLIAKLFLNVLALYTSASSLVSSCQSSKISLRKGDDVPLRTEEPSPDLVRYLSEGREYAEAMSRKWLGVDAGESGDATRIGEAIVWLRAAKKTLDDGGSAAVTTSGKSGGLFKMGAGKTGKEEKKERKGRVGDALASVDAFLSVYEKTNNTVYFTPLPPLASLVSRTPAGRAVLASKVFFLPRPIYGPGSESYLSRADVDDLAEVVEALAVSHSSGAAQGGAGYY